LTEEVQSTGAGLWIAGVEEAEIRETVPTALLTGFDSQTVEGCLRHLGPELHLLMASSEGEALRLLGSQPVGVLALGATVSGERARRLLEEADATPGAEARLNHVLAGGPDPSLFQDLIDRDRIFHLSQEPVPPADLMALLRSAGLRWSEGLQRGDGEDRRRADRDAASVEIRAFVRGEIERQALEKVGIGIKDIEDGYEFSNSKNLVAKVTLCDVAKGFLRFRSDPEALRAWAGLVVAGSSFIDLGQDFEESPEGDMLLGALWDAWFRQNFAEDVFVVVERLAVCE
jgi:hypothetical protein